MAYIKFSYKFMIEMFSTVIYAFLYAQLCPTLFNPMDYSLPDSSVHEFSRQEYWSGLPFPTPRDRPNPGIEPSLLHLLQWQVDSLPLSHQGGLSIFPQIQGSCHHFVSEHSCCEYILIPLCLMA